ncbi:DUF3078 domain-containing protein [Flavobacteriaceae bacterium 3-367]|uniref:DUF3078 domain-containing protein n=1 Tax=Eudoraea algarum TaxID=3417568 RepID=UPI00328099FC
MPSSIYTKALVSFLLSFAFNPLFAQDSIPPQQAVDSLVIDTIVIRTPQSKIKNIPRGVVLTNPFISFKTTKPLTQRFKRFKFPSFWVKENKLGLNLSEVAFVNWNAGGNNSISGLGNAKFVRNYKFRYVQWDNDLDLRYGLNAQEGRKLQKTDDAIRLSSTFGYRRDTITNWYYSVKANFNTQFDKGFQDADRTNLISNFMAPGYLFLGAGTSYIPEGKKFNLYISPITQKATFVLDQDLADQGAFGVEKAVLDAEGNVLQEGKNVFMEFGFLITNTWEKQVYKNMVINHRLSLYTDYLRSFGNIDVNWELLLNLTVNEYVNASIGTHIIFDDDIRSDEETAVDGTVINPGTPRIQFKQILGVGLSYSF